MTSDAPLPKHTLRGHRKQVLCLAHSSERLVYYSSGKKKHAPKHTADDDSKGAVDGASIPTDCKHQQPIQPCLLLSGSEDGTARLWDLRTSKTAICMIVPRGEEDAADILPEVTSVTFHPSVAEEWKGEDNSNNHGVVGDGASNSILGDKRDCTV